MENSRSSTPEAPPQDLWSSILDSVSSSRSIPSKQILLLGQPSTGKSTIAAALLQKAVADSEKDDQSRTDFALGYDFADVRDEGDEDTLARLSVYTIPSANSAYTALLPHFLPPRTAIPHTLVMIVLDWTRPWTFVEDLQLWLQWVETWTKGDNSREVDIVREESRERLQSYLQHYTEPTADPLPQNSTLSNTLLPLGPGTFTHNQAGIPIVVCCTKADLIDEEVDMAAGASGMGGMVKGKAGDWEERTDGIMQVLRTICLKYGASLFYTTPLPATLQALRQHALHLLFAPPAPSPGLAGTDPPAPARNIFPFHHKPNTLDRDRVVVPAGWDSWGKITVMRDGFDPKMWGEAWEKDLDPELQGNDGPVGGGGAKKLFAAFVPDQGAKPPPLPAFNSPVPEQAFLAKNYDENAKKPDRDPRGAFRNPADIAGASAGIVGPMGSSSFNLPNVERALTEMESGGAAAGSERAASAQAGLNDAARNRLASSTGGRSATGGASSTSRPAALSALGPGGAPAGRTGGPLPPSPQPGATSSAAGGVGGAGAPTQHEVLQKFFQDLLNTRDRGGAGSSASRQVKPNGTSASRSTTPAPTAPSGGEADEGESS
ncbi:hypothetical protein AX16_003109 [Volvariella volvacea WC 439]|nr:hypothetical protein AX16_003109 [Volvariella volvacea WC 439]